MYNGIKYFITFSLGAAVGSVVAWRFLKTKYEQLKNEEVEEVREYYANKNKHEDSEGICEEDTEAQTNVGKQMYEKMISIYDGTSNEESEQEGGSEMEKDVYVITPEEFASEDEYQLESLNYYADGVLTDDFDNRIEDVEAMVGDALDHFGEYEDDSVFVKNDRYKCCYEILKDVRNFSDVENQSLNLTDDDE